VTSHCEKRKYQIQAETNYSIITLKRIGNINQSYMGFEVCKIKHLIHQKPNGRICGNLDSHSVPADGYAHFSVQS